MTDLLFDFGSGPVPAHRHPNGGGWVADTARVEDTAYVGPEAQVFRWASVSGEAQVFGTAQVFDKARVSGEARVSGKARVYGTAQVYGEAQVSGTALVSRTPLVLAGLEYLVTVTDTHVQIGCTCKTLGELLGEPPPEHCPRREAAREGIVALARSHQEEI